MILNSKIFYRHSYPLPSNPCPPRLASASPQIGRKRLREREREIERERGKDRERERKRDRERVREQERDIFRRAILRLFLLLRITPFIFPQSFPDISKKQSTPSFLTAARYTVRSYDPCNHWTRLNWPGWRKVENTYVRTYIQDTYTRINFI